MVVISKEYVIAALVVLLIVVLSKAIKNDRELKRYKDQQKNERIYYNYQAPGSEFYLMTPKQRLEYYYDRLPEKEKRKIVDYAETLQKQLEAERYSKKP